MKFFFDTSVLVAAAVQTHRHHVAGFAAFRQVINGTHSGAVSTHGLAETFSTLTRLPVVPPIHPSEAYRYVIETILTHCETIALTEKDYLAILEAGAKVGTRGGSIYDAIHLHCAEKAHCDRIYTFNLTDFVRIAPQLQNKIVSP